MKTKQKVYPAMTIQQQLFRQMTMKYSGSSQNNMIM
jgi:hypothetical protein